VKVEDCLSVEQFEELINQCAESLGRENKIDESNNKNKEE
jgi:hypothetical protein